MSRIWGILLLSLGLFGLISCQLQEDKASPYAYLYKDLPFDMPVLSPPVFPDNRVSLSEVGGVGDGQVLNTAAFETAMEKLTGQGGGTLYVPAGVWLTGPIVFRSNIHMYLEKGAVILFSRNKDLYPLVETIFEGLDTRRCQSPISGRNLENIAITGHGAIDGSGDEWR
ncbi:MAG: glycoside hydrolase family 28 protein, partial [Bacteroidales bacterium]|nr:glycoside hydrolase family 28 protein [Bacteroidales bacterium]